MVFKGFDTKYIPNGGKGSVLFSNDCSKKKKKCIFLNKRSIFIKKMLCI